MSPSFFLAEQALPEHVLDADLHDIRNEPRNSTNLLAEPEFGLFEAGTYCGNGIGSRLVLECAPFESCSTVEVTTPAISKKVDEMHRLQRQGALGLGAAVAGTPAKIDAAFTAIKLRLQANYFDDVGRIEQVHFAGGV